MFTYTVTNDTIRFIDAVGFELANVNLCKGDAGDPYVIVTPTCSLCDKYRDARNPFTLLRGRYQFDMLGFLNFIAQVCAWEWEDGYAPTIRGNTDTEHIVIVLTRQMDTAQLAELLQFPGDTVSEWRKRHMTFQDQSDPTNGHAGS